MIQQWTRQELTIQTVWHYKNVGRTSKARYFWSTMPYVEHQCSEQAWCTFNRIWISICEGWDMHWNHTLNQYDDQHGKFWPCIPEALSYCYEESSMGERRNRKTACSQGHLQQQIKLVSSDHHSTQQWWRKIISYWLQSSKKVTRNFTWPMPKVEDIFSKLNGSKYFTTFDLKAGYHHIPLDKSSIPKQLLIHLSENTSTSRYHLDWHKLLHTFKNWWPAFWRILTLQ